MHLKKTTLGFPVHSKDLTGLIVQSNHLHKNNHGAHPAQPLQRCRHRSIDRPPLHTGLSHWSHLLISLRATSEGVFSAQESDYKLVSDMKNPLQAPRATSFHTFASARSLWTCVDAATTCHYKYKICSQWAKYMVIPGFKITVGWVCCSDGLALRKASATPIFWMFPKESSRRGGEEPPWNRKDSRWGVYYENWNSLWKKHSALHKNSTYKLYITNLQERFMERWQ